MRKVLAIFLAGLMLFGLLACGESDATSSTPESQTTTAATTVTTGGDVGGASSTTAGRNPSTTTKADYSPVTTNGAPMVLERPVTYNTAILYNKQSSSYDEQAEELRLSIVNSKSVVGKSESGNTYYISPNGNDNNDGKSPATAWRTLANLQSPARFGIGDVVLFERNAVYRGFIPMASWVSYGAYGEGPKPAIYGSARNYADPALWEQTKTANVWRLNVGADTPDVGNIVFDHGVECASPGKQLRNKLTGDFQFYHDEAAGYVYLYLAAGNPGEVYKDIEVCVKRPVFGRLNGAEVSNITIDNLCIKYSGSFGVVFSKTANITITNCEIGWIGGSMMDEDVRYGNGIEFNSHVDKALIKNNWIYQCYDAGYTNQGRGAKHVGIQVVGNLVEYCNYNFEIFCGKAQGDGTYTGMIKDCVYENNVLRFAGYGFGTKNRIGSSDIVASNICYWYNVEPTENTVIRGNVLDTAYRYLLVAAYVNDQHKQAPIVTGNTWIQNGAKNTAVALQVDVAVHGWNSFSSHELSSANQTAMTASVKKIDKSPVKILFEK